MDKVKLWKQGEPLTAKKLNQEVQAINKLLGKYANGATASPDFNGFAQSQALIREPLADIHILEMFSKDGEGVLLNGNIKGFKGSPGIYARTNTVRAMTSCLGYIAECKLKMIACQANLKQGGIIYEAITANENEGIITNCIRYAEDKSQVPTNRFDGTNLHFNRVLGRLVIDCKFANCANQKRLKLIDTNETTLPPITATRASDTLNNHTDCKRGRQKLSLLNEGVLINQVSGLSNEGGLQFVYHKGNSNFWTGSDNAYKGIRSGVELYGMTECAGGYNLRTSLNEAITTPQASKFETTIFCYPVKQKIYKQSDYRWSEDRTICSGRIKLQSKKIADNNWQIGFAQGGQIQITTYEPTKYQFDDRYFQLVDCNGTIFITLKNGVSC